MTILHLWPRQPISAALFRAEIHLCSSCFLLLAATTVCRLIEGADRANHSDELTISSFRRKAADEVGAWSDGDFYQLTMLGGIGNYQLLHLVSIYDEIGPIRRNTRQRQQVG